ncbi:MAG TPA: 50S ribosomal protein L19e [Nitrososphaeraceae archaeon]|jgi:large subunit ribosomal protein L19e|nr:50S ribosomal protein L19e [Nitrososphaeraceae archaeon]HET8793483.1 50S ribosomal protein L19e [Nitrososphaeraceae archaeon]HJT82929.1 50S ribosomal protein L19e [Nitrososphaeraceae archaeon]
MVVNLKKKRELVARMLKVGSNRVKFEPDKLDDISDSITRDDIRSLIKNGVIWTSKPKGTSRSRAKAKLEVKKKHGTGPGSKKGHKTARTGKKELYVKKIRTMRYHLKVLKDRNDINREIFWSLYKKINGGQIRSLAHLRGTVKESKSQ